MNERVVRLAEEGADVPLPETLGGRYRLGRELGRGGMARVYLARDSKHARDVAVKVIRQDLAASLGRERFLREIGIAARLRHPNIVPLYDSGDADGVLYFVMPYEDGPSLRERLDRERLSVAECVSVLRDVARALAYAHEHGVVHRDVKPDNVMLSGGAAVVTDFGIAKALSVAQGDGSAATLTQLGAGLGTPAYMAPEQAVGDPTTDHRADIYSFGCLAYELFAGNPPFHDLPTHELIAAHVGTKPVPVTAMCAEVPESIARLIDRCLEKNPAARPQSTQEMLRALDGATTTAFSAPSTAREGRRRTHVFRWAALALAAAIGTTGYVFTRHPGLSGPITLAVLPFDNIGADSAMDFVARGLADELASALTPVPGIQIKSRSGARAYRVGPGVDLAQAGEKLKADYLITGVVRQERGGWILSADMTRAVDAASLWAGKFNLGPDEQAGAAEMIARTLVTALRSRFSKSIGAPPILAANQQTANPEAYRLYLRGQEKLDRRSESVSIKESVDLFREAIHEDTMYARAYSGLSMALALSPAFQGVSQGDVDQGLRSTARRALDLDSTLAQPHVALGLAYGRYDQWDSAANEFQTAIRLDARHVEARVQYARHLRNRGRLAEAMNELRVARAEDPASAMVLSQTSYVYYLDHQMDSALVESQRALQNDSTMNSLGQGALVRLGSNLLLEARALADRTPAAFLSTEYVIAKSGDPIAARRRLRTLDAETPQPSMAETRRALTYLGLGDTAQALSALERATDKSENWPVVFSFLDPMYDSIRRSARFQGLLSRVGLGGPASTIGR